MDLQAVMGPAAVDLQRGAGAAAVPGGLDRAVFGLDVAAGGGGRDQYCGGGADRGAAPVFDGDVHISGRAVPRAASAVCGAGVFTAGGRDLPGNLPLSVS